MRTLLALLCAFVLCVPCFGSLIELDGPITLTGVDQVISTNINGTGVNLSARVVTATTSDPANFTVSPVVTEYSAAPTFMFGAAVTDHVVGFSFDDPSPFVGGSTASDVEVLFTFSQPVDGYFVGANWSSPNYQQRWIGDGVFTSASSAFDLESPTLISNGFIGPAVNQTIVFDPPSGSTLNEFTGLTTLSWNVDLFAGAFPSAHNGIAFGNITPEPATGFGFLLAGLAGIAALRRR